MALKTSINVYYEFSDLYTISKIEITGIIAKKVINIKIFFFFFTNIYAILYYLK